MALWKVAVIGGRDAVDYDEYDAYVVRAETEDEARALAEALAYIGHDRWRHFLDPAKTTCEAIAADGPSEIIVESFNAG